MEPFYIGEGGGIVDICPGRVKIQLVRMMRQESELCSNF